LQIHRDMKKLQAYELTIAKNGPKLKELQDDAKQSRTVMSLPTLLSTIDFYLDHPVVDKTGLKGPSYEVRWDQTELVKELPRGGFTIERNLAPSIFQSVQQNLGLKLELGNLLMEVLVVDRVEEASSN
jgi:uncharacterized protein (TIGR03435 family)